MLAMKVAVAILIIVMLFVAGCATVSETQPAVSQQTVETPLDSDLEEIDIDSNDTEDLADLEDDLAAIEDL